MYTTRYCRLGARIAIFHIGSVDQLGLLSYMHALTLVAKTLLRNSYYLPWRVCASIHCLQLGPLLSSSFLVLIPQQTPQDFTAGTLRNDIDELDT